jgi:hypothetical protein
METPANASGGTTRCPACGAPLAAEAEACAVCGARVGGIPAAETMPDATEETELLPALDPGTEKRCDWCGAVNPLAEARCRQCGALFPRPEQDALVERAAAERMRALEDEIELRRRKRGWLGALLGQ